jgi:Predicted membrane protein
MLGLASLMQVISYEESITHVRWNNGIFSGIYAIVSGYDGYLDKMTNSPIAMLLLYLGAGISGILVLPLILTKNKWLAILVAVIMVLTGILAFIIGFPSIGGHLKDFAHAP